MFVYQCRKFIGSYAAAMGGVDAVVFTAGVGENTPDVRQRAVEGLSFLGLDIDKEKNAKIRGVETNVSSATSRAQILVIPTNEELAIARETDILARPLKG